MADATTSAQVVLGESGDVEKVADYFRRAGFDIGPVVANNFSITGPEALFEKKFGSSAPKDDQLELSLRKLPDSVKDDVDAVTFSRPPDFGPTSY